jgi:hypothetical protein
MAMNFPNSPTVGDKYPTSPVTGQPQYTWNGTMWTTHGIAPPSPGKVPIYTDGSNPMTAQLTLAGDPVAATDAADKHYVDAGNAALAAQGNVRYDIAQSLTLGQQLQARQNIGATPIPAGTVMVFYQSAAPLGWTQVTTQNDKALRVVSGSGGVAGGTNPFSTVMAQTVTGSHTLSLAEAPAGMLSSAVNTITTYFGGSSTLYAPVAYPGRAWQWGNSYIVGTDTGYYPSVTTYASVSYTSYGQYAQSIQVQNTNAGGGAHNHPLTMQIQYCDVILASKT